MAAPRGERGAAIVEFALVSSIAICLLVAIVDFGYALYTDHLVTDIARIGARYAMVRGSSCIYSGCPATSASIQTFVRSEAPGVVASAVSVQTTWSPTTTCTASPYNGPGCLVSVQVSYSYRFFAPVLGNFLAPMTSTSQATISQ